MLKVRDLAHLDLFEKIAGAFTSGCRSQWYELPKDLNWYYFDDMFSYAHDLPLQDGGNLYSELVDRLILMHRKVGDVSPVLVCLNGQRYEPALLNPATGEGYRIRMLRGERISMHAVSVSPAVRIVRGWGGASNPGYKPETVYTIKAWRLPEKNRLVIDIRIETSTATYMDDAWYRLDLHDLFERCSTRETAIRIREDTTRDAPPQIKWTSKYEYFIQEISDRYWSWNIFSNPWINRQGELEFLNSCSLLPFWIIRIGVRRPDE